MQVHVPDKRDSVIRQALKDLYLLKEAIKHSTGDLEKYVKSLDQIRSKLSKVVK